MKSLLSLLTVCISVTTHAQNPDLKTCRDLAAAHYPQYKSIALAEEELQTQIKMIEKNYLPQIAVNGQATHQSDVTSLPVKLPNVNIPEISKNQYRIYSEITQPLTDLWIIGYQKNLLKAKQTVEMEKSQVELQKIREKVDQLYFGILLSQEQEKMIAVSLKDIENNIKRNQELIRGGILSPTTALLLEAEKLKLEQKQEDQSVMTRQLFRSLELFTGKILDPEYPLPKPVIIASSGQGQRREISLLDMQQKGLDAQYRLLDAKWIPKLNVFFQGGYGRPALNMLDNTATTYYLTGARFQWNISAFYTMDQEKKLIRLQQQQLEIQKENYLLQNRAAIQHQEQELLKLKNQIQRDQEILEIRTKIRQSAESQISQGTLSINELVQYLNAEEQARQQIALHQIQLYYSQILIQTLNGQNEL